MSDIISHYTGPSASPAWTENKPAGETTHNIPGINGQLAAIQSNTETPVLQLVNLHGDIIATASLSETATELVSKADTSEFGVPTTGLPPKYSWLGSIELPTELASGVIAMGARSYVPQVGRLLQPDPIPGGSASAYTYTFGDPVNSSDPSGAYTATASTALAAVLSDEAEAAARAAAEAAARAAAAAAGMAGPQYAGEEENWGEEEEGGEPVARAAGYSDEWVCRAASGILAAGILLATGATPIGAIGATVAATAFGAGCELGRSENRVYVSGLPHESSEGVNCF